MTTFYYLKINLRFPPFLLYMLGANLGKLLYGDVSVMLWVCDGVAQISLSSYYKSKS